MPRLLGPGLALQSCDPRPFSVQARPPVGGACVTLAKKLVGGVSRHNRGGACRLFKVKVSETKPKITPDQASLSPSGVIQPASQQFPVQSMTWSDTHPGREQQTDKTKIPKIPL